MFIINDDNYQSYIEPEDDKGKGYIPRMFEVGSSDLLEVAAPADFPLLPRSQWAARIKKMDGNKNQLFHLMQAAKIKCKDQGSTNYCHVNSPTLAMEALRLVQGLPYVNLSSGSMGGLVTNFTNRGAWIPDALKVSVKYGASTTAFVPANQISKSGWKPGAVENALLHRVVEWWDIPQRNMFDYCMTLILSRFPVCTAHNWWRHAVTIVGGFVDSNGKFGFVFRNSWGSRYGDDGYFIMLEGKATPDEAYSPRSVTASIQ